MLQGHFHYYRFSKIVKADLSVVHLVKVMESMCSTSDCLDSVSQVWVQYLYERISRSAFNG